MYYNSSKSDNGHLQICLILIKMYKLYLLVSFFLLNYTFNVLPNSFFVSADHTMNFESVEIGRNNDKPDN